MTVKTVSISYLFSYYWKFEAIFMVSHRIIIYQRLVILDNLGMNFPFLTLTWTFQSIWFLMVPLNSILVHKPCLILLVKKSWNYFNGKTASNHSYFNYHLKLVDSYLVIPSIVAMYESVPIEYLIDWYCQIEAIIDWYKWTEPCHKVHFVDWRFFKLELNCGLSNEWQAWQ